MIRQISVLTIRIMRIISIQFVKLRIFTLISIHFVVKFRILTPTSIHFVKFRIFSLISIHFLNFEYSHWFQFEQIHQLHSTSLENPKFCTYAFCDYSIKLGKLIFQKRGLKLFLRSMTEQQVVVCNNLQQSICRNIGIWKDNFVRKWCVFNHFHTKLSFSTFN